MTTLSCRLALLMLSAVGLVAMGRAASESSVSPQITVLSVQEIIPHGSIVQPFLKVPTTVTALPEGGFLIAGVYRTDQYHKGGRKQFYLKISAAGAVIWERESELPWETPAPDLTFQFADVGYGIVGQRHDEDVDADIKTARRAGQPFKWNQILSAHQYDSLVPISPTGTVLPEIHLSELGNSRYIGCGAPTNGGLIFAGEAFSPPETSWRGGIARIEMRDRAGKLLWAHQYPGDQDKALDVAPQLGQAECGSVVGAPDGSALIALNVRVLPVTHSADEWVKVASSSAVNHQGVLVIRVDAAGHELFRALDDRFTDALLVPAQNRTLLIERTAPEIPAPGTMSMSEYVIALKKIEETGRRVRLKYFDATANGKTALPDITTGALETLHAAYRTTEGDLLLAGCPLLGGNNYLVHVDPTGAVSPVIELTPGALQQCATFTFGAGTRPREAVALVSSDLVGAELVTIKY